MAGAFPFSLPGNRELPVKSIFQLSLYFDGKYLRYAASIIDTLYALDKIAPGTANYDTLLYGVEAKFYSIKPDFIDDDFRITPNVFAIGDGAGITRGLAQAGANGLYVANAIINK